MEAIRGHVIFQPFFFLRGKASVAKLIDKRSANYLSMGQIQTVTYFVNKVSPEHSCAYSFTFVLLLHNTVVVTETIRPKMPITFTILPFTNNVCPPK